jgi:hypothetical protein
VRIRCTGVRALGRLIRRRLSRPDAHAAVDRSSH